MKRLTNLTPHPITVVGVGADGGTVIPPSGVVARVTSNRESLGTYTLPDGRVCEFTTEGAESVVTGLPPDDGITWWLVSLAVRLAVPDRTDVVSPGDLIRDATGQPVGCRGLAGNRCLLD